MVMGLGILGLIAVQLAKAAGAVPVIAVDPVKERREKALTFGADYALDPMEDGFVDKVKELTGVGSRCIPFAQENLSDTCVCCGKPAKMMVYWGKAY